MRQDSARSPASIFLRLGRSIQTVRLNVKTAVWGWFRLSADADIQAAVGATETPRVALARRIVTSARYVVHFDCPPIALSACPVEERRTPVGFPNLQQTIAQFMDWALDNRESLTLLLAAVGLVGGLIKFIHSRQRNAPQIALGFERVDDLLGDESSFVINVTNVDGSAAKKVRTEWHPESSCDLRPPAQPFTLLPGTTQPCEFIVRPIDAILRISRSAAERRLGSFAVTCDGGWRRRAGASLVMVERDTDHAQNAIELRPLPRKHLRDVVPIIDRMADTRATRKRAQRVAERLA
jgi:hypothetical protein